MARHKADRQPAFRGQDHYWRVITELAREGGMTIEDVHLRCNGRRDSLRDYIQRLERGGWLRRTGERGQAVVYALARTSRTAPRVRKDGSEVTQGRGREQLWRTMRMLGTFDYRELAGASSTEEVSVAPSEAKDYVKHLHRAGYLTLVAKAGRTCPARYRLTRITGPLPPQVQRVKRIWDPNLGQVVWPSDEEE